MATIASSISACTCWSNTVIYLYLTHKSDENHVSIQASMADFHQMDEGLVEKSLRKQLKENLALLKNLLEASYILLDSETNS